MFVKTQSKSPDPINPALLSGQSGPHGQQDASVQVSLLPCICHAPQLGCVGVTILGRERVTFRIGAEDSDCLEYEDITEVTSNSLEERGCDFPEYEDITVVTNICLEERDNLATPPPLLPPRDKSGEKDHKRKNLRAHLGLGEEEITHVFDEQGTRGTRRRKDLTRFLGMWEEGTKDVSKEKRSILESLLGRKRPKALARKQGDQEVGVSFQPVIPQSRPQKQQIGQQGLVRRSPPQQNTTSTFFPEHASNSEVSSGDSSEEEKCRTASFSSVISSSSSLSSSSSTSSYSGRYSHFYTKTTPTIWESQQMHKREKHEVQLAVERGMPVIPFIPVEELLGRKRERRPREVNSCSNMIYSKSLESIIELAKDQLNPPSSSLSSLSSGEPIYMDMGGRPQSSAPAYPPLSSIQPCFTDYMHMEVLQHTYNEDYLDMD